MSGPELKKRVIAALADPATRPEQRTKFQAWLDNETGGGGLVANAPAPKIPGATKPIAKTPDFLSYEAPQKDTATGNGIAVEGALPGQDKAGKAPDVGALTKQVDEIDAQIKAIKDAAAKRSAGKMSNLEVAGRGAAHYQSLGGADEMAGLGGSTPRSGYIPGFAEGSGMPAEVPSLPVDERHGEASGRTVGRGIDAPKMGPEAETAAEFEASRKGYASGDTAAREQNAPLFHVAGVASTIPSMAAGGAGVVRGGLSGLIERMGLAAMIGGGVGGVQGALSAEPGHRQEGAQQGIDTGLALGPLAEVGVSGLRKAGGAIAERLTRGNQDLRLAREGGADFSLRHGIEPGADFKTAQAEAVQRDLAPSVADVASEKVVPKTAETINARVSGETKAIHDAKQAYFASPEGQRQIPAQTLSDFIDSAGERYMGSDGKPLNPAKARVFERKAREIISPEMTTEGFDKAIKDKSPTEIRSRMGRRGLTAEDLDKLRADFTAQSSHDKYDPGVQGAFSGLARDVRKLIEEHHPQLHEINQEAGTALGQTKGAIKQLGFSEDKSGFHVDPEVPMQINTREDALRLGQAIRGAGYDERKALAALARDRPDVVDDLKRVWGIAATERLQAPKGLNVHTNIGLSGPHAVMSGVTKNLGFRAAAAKNLPGGAGAATGAAATRIVDELRGMLGLENQQ